MSKERKGLKYLFACQECGTKRFVSWVEQNRASRPKCFGCGCTRLELVSEEAKEDRARLQRERIVGTGGSLVLPGELDRNLHRRVT